MISDTTIFKTLNRYSLKEYRTSLYDNQDLSIWLRMFRYLRNHTEIRIPIVIWSRETLPEEYTYLVHRFSELCQEHFNISDAEWLHYIRYLNMDFQLPYSKHLMDMVYATGNHAHNSHIHWIHESTPEKRAHFLTHLFKHHPSKALRLDKEYILIQSAVERYLTDCHKNIDNRYLLQYLKSMPHPVAYEQFNRCVEVSYTSVETPFLRRIEDEYTLDHLMMRDPYYVYFCLRDGHYERLSQCPTQDVYTAIETLYPSGVIDPQWLIPYLRQQPMVYVAEWVRNHSIIQSGLFWKEDEWAMLELYPEHTLRQAQRHFYQKNTPLVEAPLHF